jgi:hypothetical protein
MGKRELVLISIFVALGALVYQFTAPPPPPGSDEVSIGGIFNKLRREVQGARETAPAEWTGRIAADASIRQIRITLSTPNDLTVTGEERSDVAVELRAVGRGYDQAEAKVAAAAARLRLERTGEAIVISADTAARQSLPKQARIDQMTIVVRVPRRLSLRIEPHVGRLLATSVASVEIMGSRGETRLGRIAGSVQLAHAGGRLEIENVASLKLTARSSRGSVKNVAGACTLDATGGELELGGIAGPLDAELRNATVKLIDLEALKPPLRLNASGGLVSVDGLRTEARLDGRQTDIDVTMAAAAPVTIYSTAEDIVVTAPPGGYTLDAVATDGQLRIEDGDLQPQDASDQRVSGRVRGGGPALTLRVSRSNITVRKPEGK